MVNNTHLLTVGDFVLNTNSRKLFNGKEEISLAPTLFTLLCFFVENQNKTLSKETIISNVWKGKIVVEANINQNIKKLRDLLGDSASNPKYIETVTGQGFRFIANSEAYRAAPSTEMTQRTPNYLYLLGALFIIVVSLVVFVLSVEKKESAVKELFPLTTLKGVEYYPNLSSDKKHLLFNYKNGSSWDIYVKPTDKESYYAILKSENNEVFPVLSEDQTKLIYFLTGKNKCGLYMSEIDLHSYAVGRANEIKKCTNVTGRLRAEWINAQEIFISINDDKTSPANIYRYNLESRLQTLITKPDSQGFGDYELKFSNQQQKLAYVRNIGWSSSEIWVYDLVERAHFKIKSVPSNVTGIDWDNKGRLIFQSGGKTISRIGANGEGEEVIAKFFSSVYKPFVLGESKMGVVTGSVQVFDVNMYSIDKQQESVVISSSANDYGASGGSNIIAFVSTRSGRPQIWTRNKEGIDSQLTHFEESYEIQSLTVSQTGGLIMFNKSGIINIIDLKGTLVFSSENYSSQPHSNPVFDIDNDRFLYSVQRDGEWGIQYRHLSAPNKKRDLFKGVYAKGCIAEDCIYYFKEGEPFLYKYMPQRNSSVKVAEVGIITNSNKWSLFDEEHLLYIEKGARDYHIVKLNLNTGKKVILLETKARTFSFDRAKNLIYSNTFSQGNADMKYYRIEP